MPTHRLKLSPLALALFLAGCATPDNTGRPTDTARLPTVSGKPTTGVLSPGAAAAAGNSSDAARLYKGTGQLVKGQLPEGRLPPGPPAGAVAGGMGVTLNFEAADLREVVRNILGDILNQSYTIDPAVGGAVTIRTSAGIPREMLPATLETMLRMNGATMVKDGELWKIVPQAAAVRGNVTPQLGNSQRSLPPGFSVQIVPLRYVGVKEMLRLLEPFARDAAAVRPDELRNLLILAGTELELKHLLDAIDMFDVDWMAGMSVGVFTLKSTDVKSMMAELDKVIGDKNLSPLAGILRLIPLERLNALLVITPQPAYLDEAKKWIERLDRLGGDGGGGVDFYVYNLQNTRAEKLGPLLQQVFTGRAAPSAGTPAPSVAPGTPAGTIVNPPTFQPQTSVPVANPMGASTVPASAAASAAAGSGIVRNLQVVADKDNNTLMFVATAAEYAVIEAALKKLDVPARQVVMEVTIASVALTDEIQFGVEWLFKGGAPSGRGTGGNLTRSGPFNPGVPTPANATTSPGLSLAQGFFYIINNANFPGGIQAVLHLLDSYGNTKVIANPHVAALDNQKATIKSGDRIPINQQTIVGGTVNAVTTTAQYIDTGVLLQVTPHINAGGLVTLEVQAEVSVPGNSGCTAEQGCAPPISTRSVQTIVSVPSGQTMVMGGLINEAKQTASEGLPWLSRIPLLGGLFGSQSLTNNRTELIMFITPRVVENLANLDSVIDDLRRRMEQLDSVFPPPRSSAAPTSGKTGKSFYPAETAPAPAAKLENPPAMETDGKSPEPAMAPK